MDYASLIAPLIEAVKELARKVSDLATTVAGFGQKFTTNELCVGSTCVTESQLKTLLQNSGQQGTPPAAGGGSEGVNTQTATSTIIVSQSANGTISPDTQFDIASGANVSFTITPVTGFDVGTLLIDNQPVATSTTYDFTNVTGNHTITATFVSPIIITDVP